MERAAERYSDALKRNRDYRARSRSAEAVAVHDAWIRFYEQLLRNAPHCENT